MEYVSISARFKVISDEEGRPLVIQDVGPWDHHPTITNDAERVVEHLAQKGMLPKGRQLFYVDSERDMTELLIDDHGFFVGFGITHPYYD